MEDHQLKMLSDADLKSEHALAVQMRNGALTERLRREIESRDLSKPKPQGNHTGQNR